MSGVGTREGGSYQLLSQSLQDSQVIAMAQTVLARHRKALQSPQERIEA